MTSRELAITPDMQLLVNPALNSEEDQIWVFGLRARLAFQARPGGGA